MEEKQPNIFKWYASKEKIQGLFDACFSAPVVNQKECCQEKCDDEMAICEDGIGSSPRNFKAREQIQSGNWFDEDEIGKPLNALKALLKDAQLESSTAQKLKAVVSDL